MGKKRRKRNARSATKVAVDLNATPKVHCPFRKATRVQSDEKKKASKSRCRGRIKDF
jgi:hypothetical protein